MTNIEEKPTTPKLVLGRVDVKIRVERAREYAEYKTIAFSHLDSNIHDDINIAIRGIPQDEFLKVKAKMEDTFEELVTLLNKVGKFEPNPLNDASYEIYKRNLKDLLLRIEDKLESIYKLIGSEKPCSFKIIDNDIIYYCCEFDVRILFQMKQGLKDEFLNITDFKDFSKVYDAIMDSVNSVLLAHPKLRLEKRGEIIEETIQELQDIAKRIEKYEFRYMDDLTYDLYKNRLKIDLETFKNTADLLFSIIYLDVQHSYEVKSNV